MATLSEIRLMTAEDLLELPTGTGVRYELIEGELIEMPPAGQEHGESGMNSAFLLTRFIKQGRLGKVLAAETGFIIKRNPDTVLAPDFAFIPADRIPAEGLPRGFGSIVPALVVEVISPNDRAGEIESKIQRWLEFGVDQVWVIYPESKRVYVYEPGGKYAVYQGEDTIPGGSVLPGLEMRVGEIFEG